VLIKCLQNKVPNRDRGGVLRSALNIPAGRKIFHQEETAIAQIWQNSWQLLNLGEGGQEFIVYSFCLTIFII
jgi:hypothetical protein